MATVVVKVESAIVDLNGMATIQVTANDGVSQWIKTYTYHQTTPILLDAFKARVKSDLLADFGIKNQLAEITPIVGKTFNLTI